MSTAGIFTIITNDGKQDRMLMATAMLSERLRRIQEVNAKQNPWPANDVRNLPTLLDIERTHVLFVNAHFKPFAALGFEYGKVGNNASVSLSSSSGARVTFSIPQFGDFFHDIALHVTIAQPTVTVTASTASDTPAFRWAEFPGERLCKNVEQEVNGNKLDYYSSTATTFHRIYRVAPNKLAGWKKCVGQELPVQGYITQPGVLNGVGSWIASGTGPSSRFGAQIYNGNQTPTLSKSGHLEMFIPLLFWYCKDVRLAVPSIAIPYGQRNIHIDMAPARELVGLVPRGASTWDSPGGSIPTLTVNAELYMNNIFMNPEVHTIYIKRVGFSLIRVHREQNIAVTAASGNHLLQNMKWPLEYMYIGAKLDANHEPSSDGNMAKTMDTWHRFAAYTDTNFKTSGQEVEYLQQLFEVPVGQILTVTHTSGLLAASIAANLSVPLAVGDAIRIGGTTYTINSMAGASTVGTPIATTAAVLTPVPSTISSTFPANTIPYKVTKQGLQATAKVWTNLFSNLTVSAHGIDIYKDFPVGFYNAYTAYHYGGPNINAPEESDTMFVPFCLYPGTYQPSGHINVSRAREFYVNYNTTSLSGLGTPMSGGAKIYVVASCLNFLLISDGSAVLRYST